MFGAPLFLGADGSAEVSPVAADRLTADEPVSTVVAAPRNAVHRATLDYEFARLARRVDGQVLVAHEGRVSPTGPQSHHLVVSASPGLVRSLRNFRESADTVELTVRRMQGRRRRLLAELSGTADPYRLHVLSHDLFGPLLAAARCAFTSLEVIDYSVRRIAPASLRRPRSAEWADALRSGLHVAPDEWQRRALVAANLLDAGLLPASFPDEVEALVS